MGCLQEALKACKFWFPRLSKTHLTGSHWIFLVGGAIAIQLGERTHALDVAAVTLAAFSFASVSSIDERKPESPLVRLTII